MTVFFIGAGPGDPELITVKGQKLIHTCPLVIYTGSLVPLAVMEGCPASTTIIDSSGKTLDELIEMMVAAHERGEDIARVHTGDPMIYGSTQEQMRRLTSHNVPYEVVPGVSSFSAAAAAIKQELTLPELSQTIILSRASGRTSVPEPEQLPNLGAIGGTLCLFLSINLLVKVTRELTPHYGADCPVVVVHKASMPEQVVVRGTLADITKKVKEQGIKSQSMIIIGHVIGHEDFADSRLYAADFSHGYRRAEGPAEDNRG